MNTMSDVEEVMTDFLEYAIRFRKVFAAVNAQLKIIDHENQDLHVGDRPVPQLSQVLAELMSKTCTVESKSWELGDYKSTIHKICAQYEEHDKPKRRRGVSVLE